MESFRKLQQLRRDFERLRILLQLVVERERIKQGKYCFELCMILWSTRFAANLDIEIEQFENTVHDLIGPGVPRHDQPYTFQLMFEHLLTEDYAASVVSTELDGNLMMKLPRQPAGLHYSQQFCHTSHIISMFSA